MATRIFIVDPEADVMEIGTCQENILEKVQDAKDLQCMLQIRNPEREMQCREARGEVEVKHNILLELNWPAIIIGLWLYMFPFLVGLAGLILDKVW